MADKELEQGRPYESTEPLVSETYVDKTLMCASAVISTIDVDRSQDVMVPAGCQLANYRRNPVVGWNHFLEFTLPIASSEGPDRKLHVNVKKDRIIATAFFTSKLKESEQVFELISERLIRATSVGYHFIDGGAKVRAQPEFSDRPGIEFREWELVEWSWTPVGDNPNALALVSGESAEKCAAILARGKLCGSSIAPVLRKSIASMAAPRNAQSTGFTLAPATPSAEPLNPFARTPVKLYGAEFRRLEAAKRNLRRKIAMELAADPREQRKLWLRSKGLRIK